MLMCGTVAIASKRRCQRTPCLPRYGKIFSWNIYIPYIYIYIYSICGFGINITRAHCTICAHPFWSLSLALSLCPSLSLFLSLSRIVLWSTLIVWEHSHSECIGLHFVLWSTVIFIYLFSALEEVLQRCKFFCNNPKSNGKTRWLFVKRTRGDAHFRVGQHTSSLHHSTVKTHVQVE